MDIILYNIITAILLVLIGYVFGSIPNGIWIGKVFFHKDVRDYGSGNSGGTNAGRVFGKKIGLLVIVLDGLKVIVPLYVCWAILTYVPMHNGLPLIPTAIDKFSKDTSEYLINWPIYWIVVVGSTLGHCYPCFSGFRGGKNVSTLVGFGLSTSWMFGFIPGIIFLILLKIKKMVSLASITMGISATVLSWTWSILMLTGVIKGFYSFIPGYGNYLEFGYVHSIMVTFVSAVLIFRHHSNITRIKNGTESKIKWMK